MVDAVIPIMNPPLCIVWTQTQINNGKQQQLNITVQACSMLKHQVSELIVISSLIRFSHLLFYAQTLEGKSDTGGCGETAGGRGWWARGRREKKRCTPHLFSSKTSTLLIKPGFCKEGPQHTDLQYLKQNRQLIGSSIRISLPKDQKY